MLNNLVGIDKNPYIIKYTKTVWGKAIILTLYWFFMHYTSVFPVQWIRIILITLVFITLFPKQRYWWLFIGMSCALLQGYLIRPTPGWTLFRANYLYWIYKTNRTFELTTFHIKLIDILLLLIVSEGLAYFARYSERYKFARYPITILYSFIILLICIVKYVPLSDTLILLIWSFIVVFNHYFWFIGYTLLERKMHAPRNFLLDYARYLPIWGFTALPYGKGSVYLQEVEAKNADEFSVTQLKGLKLCFWAFLLNIVLHYYYSGESYFHIPKLSVALSEYSKGIHYTAFRAWLCLIDRFFRMLLELTVTGHIVVATCRLCGFRILRNTYKPLQSATIAEFWNRYNFYFKELLAEFFFYPTYFRFFKTRPRVRMFFATISAAAFGNMLFHFLLVTPIILSKGFATAIRGFEAYICYAVILGISIGLSQQRHLQRKQHPPSQLKLLISYLFVVAFYSVLTLFNSPYQSQSITVNLKILGSLFNLNW